MTVRPLLSEAFAVIKAHRYSISFKPHLLYPLCLLIYHSKQFEVAG